MTTFRTEGTRIQRPAMRRRVTRPSDDAEEVEGDEEPLDGDDDARVGSGT